MMALATEVPYHLSTPRFCFRMLHPQHSCKQSVVFSMQNDGFCSEIGHRAVTHWPILSVLSTYQ